MFRAMEKFRKKYTLTLFIFAAGTAHSFFYAWSAGEYTNFALLLLSAFGAADLVDKEKIGILKPKGNGIEQAP